MKRTDLEDDELMTYLDGELGQKEARLVEQRVAASPEARTQVEALAQLRDVVRSRYDAAEAEAGPKLDALWKKLERQLDRAPAEEARAGFWAGVRDWFESYRSHVVTGAAAAAMGAFVAVMVMRQTVTAPTPGVVPPVAVAKAHNAEVESLEVPSGSGTIFQIPGASDKEASTTVIWVTHEDSDDDSGEQKDPI